MSTVEACALTQCSTLSSLEAREARDGYRHCLARSRARCPLILMLVVLVHRSMGGPAFFAHRRVGRNGKVFRCYEFRTMVNNGDEVLQQYLAANPHAAVEWAMARKPE